MSERIYIICGSLFDGENEELLKNQIITAEDGIITAVDDRTVPEEGSRVIDLSGMTVMPGLIDCNIRPDTSHYDNGAFNSEDVCMLSTLDLAAGVLKHGFMGLRIPEGNPGIADVRKAIDYARFRGARLSVSYGAGIEGGCLADKALLTKSIIREAEAAGIVPSHRGVGNDMDYFAEEIRKQLLEGNTFAEIYASGCLGMNSFVKTEMPYELIKEIADAAKDYSLPVSGNAVMPEAVRLLAGAGADNIDHASFIDADTAMLLRSRGITVVPTFSADMSLCPEKMRDALRASAKILIESGIRLGFASGAVSNGDCEGWAAEFRMRLDMGESPLSILASATSINAKICGFKDQGRIRPGFSADMTGYVISPLDGAFSPDAPDFVMRKGIIESR